MQRSQALVVGAGSLQCLPTLGQFSDSIRG